MAWKKGVKRKTGAKKDTTPVEYKIGDVIEYATNTTQEIRIVRITCRRVLMKDIVGFEGAEVSGVSFPPDGFIFGYDEQPRSHASPRQYTGRKLWGFDYQIVRVNGELLEKWRAQAQAEAEVATAAKATTE